MDAHSSGGNAFLIYLILKLIMIHFVGWKCVGNTLLKVAVDNMIFSFLDGNDFN